MIIPPADSSKVFFEAQLIEEDEGAPRRDEVVAGIREMDLIVRLPQGVPATATILARGRGRQWGIFPEPVQVEGQRFRL